MNLLILVKDEVLSTKIEEVVSSHTSIGVIKVNSCEDALGLFSLMEDIAAIIFDNSCEEDILAKVKENNIVVDLIYYGPNILTDPELNLHSFSDIEKIAYYLVKNTSDEKKIFNILDEKELYYPVKSSIIITLNVAPVDIYIRMKKDGYYHYIKYLNGDDALEPKQIKKLAEMGQIFIKRAKKDHYFQKMNNFFEKMLKDRQDGAEQTKLDIDVKEEVFNQLITVGLSAESVKVAEATIENVVQSLGKGLVKEIKKIFSADASMNFRKSYLTSILCTSIAEQMDWISEENKNSLILTAFFNDRFLTQDKMHTIDTLGMLELADLNIEEKKLLTYHAQITSDWIQDQPTIPIEVSRLVKQHHGSVDGAGFETKLSPKITNLSMVFIVAEEFAMEILKKKELKIDVKQSLEAINEKYDNPKISKIIKALFLGLKA